MKRKVTMELTVQQAAKVHDLLGLGLQDAEAACLYTPQQEAAAHRAYDTVSYTHLTLPTSDLV